MFELFLLTVLLAGVLGQYLPTTEQPPSSPAGSQHRTDRPGEKEATRPRKAGGRSIRSGSGKNASRSHGWS